MPTATHVFVKNKHIYRQCQPAYTGPHPVLDRGRKAYKLLYQGIETGVSLDRLKPAYLCPDDDIPEPVYEKRPRPVHKRTNRQSNEAQPRAAEQQPDQPTTSTGYAGAYDENRNVKRPPERPRKKPIEPKATTSTRTTRNHDEQQEKPTKKNVRFAK
uniref:Uncharacterized protein n=1 Tax=Bracon brevicornis TaxID=1563983 RepID=A0A6V7IMH2_9HYME